MHSEDHAADIESVAGVATVLGCSDDERIGLESCVVRQVVLIRGAPGFRAEEDSKCRFQCALPRVLLLPPRPSA